MVPAVWWSKAATTSPSISSQTPTSLAPTTTTPTPPQPQLATIVNSYQIIQTIPQTVSSEKPIYFSYSLNLNMGFIRTGKEPIGEGDNDADF